MNTRPKAVTIGALQASLLIAVAVSFGLGLMISGAVSAGIPVGGRPAGKHAGRAG